MDVLKKGVIPGEYWYVATCGNCNTVIRFQRSEAKFTADQRDGDFLTVLCPICGQVLNVAVNEGKLVKPELSTFPIYDR